MASNSQGQGTIRIGPLSLIALVIILCLSVLAVLSVSTSRASTTESQKQLEFVQSTYANEVAGQEFLAVVDGQLALAKANGLTIDETMANVEAAIPSVANVSGRTVSIAFAAVAGHILNIELYINDDYTYTVALWKNATTWSDEYHDEQNLWQGQQG